MKQLKEKIIKIADDELIKCVVKETHNNYVNSMFIVMVAIFAAQLLSKITGKEFYKEKEMVNLPKSILTGYISTQVFNLALVFIFKKIER